MEPGNAGMEKLIPAMNKILDVCTQVGVDMQFDFPQIAVIGCQSAGKSSVLENFVGRDFLPRGSDIVTRRPLILQLISSTEDNEEYGVFMHDKDKKFTNFDDIRKEIESVTEEIAGSKKGISHIPINLHIHSPNVLDLTLIDLPGITKVAVGDQPPDIEQQVRDMIFKYISKENCLILAVSPANSDLANSDAIKLAKEVDPQGVRTIGVITKLDLMDEGTNARKILENELLPLRRGYIGVVNRSQKHINEKKDIMAALKAERNFFMGHKDYRRFADRMGTPYLQRVLNQQLTEHIRDKLPSLQDELSKRMVSLEKKVQEFNNVNSDDPEAMKTVMLKIIRQMQSDFEKAIGGLGSEDIRTEGLSNGAIICKLFHERLPRDISQISLDSDQMRREINFAVSNIYGYRGVLFEPYMVFEDIVKKQIERLKEPVLKCIELVVGELTSAVRFCTQHIANYPNLRGDIENNIISFIHNNAPRYKQNILSLTDMELAYMNYSHDEFMKNITPRKAKGEISASSSVFTDSAVDVTGCSRIESIPDEAATHTLNGDNESMHSLEGEESKANHETKDAKDAKDEKEMKNYNIDPSLNRTVGDIYEKIDSYMRIVKKTTRDMVPKAITLYVVKELQDYINDKILMDFLGLPSDEYAEKFALSPEEAQKHDKNSKTYEACKSALEIIRTVSKETAHGVIANGEQKLARSSTPSID
ncbi:dynamin-like isoform X2 [Sitodiplosis mosellana]|uniref:dynamin-like isoform X2 n=1 Tax=Sitodiplosis mosellana TaxID=263140 RepID=UPI002444F3F5|nr:dynamin-like isoform X2 [Sitodiplosis mosellana]